MVPEFGRERGLDEGDAILDVIDDPVALQVAHRIRIRFDCDRFGFADGRPGRVAPKDMGRRSPRHLQRLQKFSQATALRVNGFARIVLLKALRHERLSSTAQPCELGQRETPWTQFRFRLALNLYRGGTMGEENFEFLNVVNHGG